MAIAAYITTAGVELLQRIISSGGTLEFVKAELGDGVCTGADACKARTSLVNKVADASQIGVERSGSTANVSIQYVNTGLSTGFSVNEIGLFAADPDDNDPVLYCYATFGGTPDWIAPESSSNYVRIYDIETAVGNVQDLTIVISPSALVVREQYDDDMEDIAGAIADVSSTANGAVKRIGDTMTGALKAPQASVYDGTAPAVKLHASASGSVIAEIRATVATGNIALRAVTPGHSSAYEDFVLPAPTRESGSATYYVLTTKSLVSIAQGGTGMSSSPSLLINLASENAVNVLAATPRPGVTGILPVAHGGTGNGTGNAPSAAKLATARNIRTDLGSENNASFDGSANAAPGVTGILPLGHGGTGATDAGGAKVNLGLQSSGQAVNITQPSGSEQVLSLYANVSNANSALNGKRVMLLLQDKAIRLYNVTDGAESWRLDVPVTVAQGGTGATNASAARTNLGVTPANIGAAPVNHGHALTDNGITGALPVSKGGTGATGAAAARTNLGITPSNIGAAPENHGHDLNGASLAGVLPISKGGTGSGTAAGALEGLGAFAAANVVNNLTTTGAGKALDARQGKVISDLIASLINGTSIGTYTIVDDAVEAVWASMSDNSVKVGRFVASGSAFIYIAMRNSSTFATLMCWSYTTALVQYNKLNGITQKPIDYNPISPVTA